MLVDISADYKDFKASSWVVLAYTLTEVGFAVAMARLSDCLGRKVVSIASFVIFLAASMGCGASTNLDQLIGFRAAQGVGGAGLYAIALISYPELSPPSKIVIVSSAMGAIVALAGVCGPVIGGLLTTYTGWRYVFWIKYVSLAMLSPKANCFLAARAPLFLPSFFFSCGLAIINSPSLSASVVSIILAPSLS